MHHPYAVVPLIVRTVYRAHPETTP